ncbi:MAG: lamin tail domain-containing protein [Kofleriaceae bacterium]|nr:lamin tail domain-containing protein [Kofleriaceae bacterium]
MAQTQWVVTFMIMLTSGASQLAGCVRDPLPAVCPTDQVGGLVISEVRGDQTASTDVLGQWIEIYNATTSPVDLAGLTVQIKRKDGGATATILITRSIEVAPQGYATIGRFDDTALPAHIDFGYANQVTAGLYTSGAITLLSCDSQIDRIIYDSLPRTGTYNLAPASGPPSATANDLAAAWCADATVGAAGTPKGANQPCP